MASVASGLANYARNFMQTFLQTFLFFMGLLLLSGNIQAGEIKVYAAASLSDALTELSALYQTSHPDTIIKASFAGSAILAKQIAKGAPADVLISADSEWVNYLEEQNLLIDESRKKILTNELVLIAPIVSKSQITLAPHFNLAASFSGRLCTGDTIAVPAGKYAKQALQFYGWWDAISTRVVGADDVRAALVFVERGECNLGIVYKTDALLSKKIKVVGTFPPESHTPIVYPMVLLKHAAPEAKVFWQFLQSREAKAVFTRYGFQPIN